ncbi:MAG TPA: efflux RND transporter periplasmic adaptor subunit [Acetobacteraceae bacterium]|nr:efflux RND transporter periplasmic adaptor subunit [Acetobacteraceae bacterium]
MKALWSRAAQAAGVVVVLAALLGFVMVRPHPTVAQQNGSVATPGVPVTTASAVRQDLPVWLRGLGAAQALNSVLIRSRVDGTLMQVAVTEGQEVKKGDLIAVIDPRPFQATLDQAVAKRSQDEAQLANARRDVARTASLVKQDFASRQLLDNQESQVAQLTAAIAGDQAVIEAAQLNLSYCFIKAPIDGRVGLRQVDPGNLIHAADASGIITVTQIRPIAVTFTLPQEDLPKISQAMARGKLPVVAFAGDGSTELGRGELLTIDNAIDASTGTIRLKAVFPNADKRLWPGQFVDASLLVDTERNVLTVPSVAVQHGPSGLFVFVVKPDSTVTRQNVTMTADNGQTAVIGSGLIAGATVVTDGQSRLNNGTRVAATAAPPPSALASGG